MSKILKVEENDIIDLLYDTYEIPSSICEELKLKLKPLDKLTAKLKEKLANANNDLERTVTELKNCTNVRELTHLRDKKTRLYGQIEAYIDIMTLLEISIDE